MNRKNILKLIKVLRHPFPGVAYNQNQYFGVDPHNECGTACCIAGHAVLVEEGDNYGRFITQMQQLRWGTPMPDLYSHIQSRFCVRAEEFLGLTIGQSCELFYCNEENEYATSEQAVRVLEHLLATGEVNWRIAMTDWLPIPRDPEEDEPEDEPTDEDYDEELIKLTEPA